MTQREVVTMLVITFIAGFALGALAEHVAHGLMPSEARNQAQTEQVPWPSATEGHHGGELASRSLDNGGRDISYLQNGGDRQRQDYLIVCDGSKNGHPARGGIRHPTDGWFYIEDNYRSSGCAAREYPFSGNAHNINGHDISRHD